MANLDYLSRLDYILGQRDGIENGAENRPSGVDATAYSEGFDFGDYQKQFLHPTVLEGVYNTRLG